MFGFKRKKKQDATLTAEKPQPKEVKWKAPMKMKFVNIHTDKEYVFSSKNNYGLSWDYFEKKHGTHLFLLKQKTNYTKDNWETIAHLQDFSLIEIEWAEHSEMVNPETDNEEDNA